MHDEHPNLVFVTARRRSSGASLIGVRRERRAGSDGIVAMKLAADDRVVSVFPGWDDFELLLVTAAGRASGSPRPTSGPSAGARAACGVSS